MDAIFKRPIIPCAIVSFLVITLIFKVRWLSPLLIVACVVAISVLVIFRKSLKYILAIVLVLLVILCMLLTMDKIDYLHFICGRTVECEFTVISDSAKFGKVSSVEVYSNGNTVPRFTKTVLSYYDGKELLAGETIIAKVKLNGLADDEYRDYYYGDSIYVKGNVSEYSKLDVKNRFFAGVGDLRRFVKDTLFSNLNFDCAALLTALTIGDKSELSSDFNASAQRTGVSHIMVVSGLHLAIIMTFIFKLTDKLIYNNWLKGIVGVLCVLLVTAICGFTLSVIRAAIMFGFSAMAPILKRDSDSLNSLCAAVITIFLLTPTAFLSVSFQLSLLAALAVILVAPFYSELLFDLLRIKRNFSRWFISTMVTSISATVFTMPVCIKIFELVSVVAPITNLLVVYPATWALTSSITAIALCGTVLPFLHKPLLLFAGLCAKYIYAAVKYVDCFPITAVRARGSAIYISYFLIFLTVAFMYLYKLYHKRRILDADNKRGGPKTRNSLKKFGTGISVVR